MAEGSARLPRKATETRPAPRRSTPSSPGLDPIHARILQLQATAGNAAVSAVLRETPAGRPLALQRYDSFEHVEAGATASFIEADEGSYVVARGDTTASIAAKLKVPEKALIERNRSKLHAYATKAGGEIHDFQAGDTIVIPSDRVRVREPAKGETLRTGQKPVTIHGVTMDYGEAMAMADFYKDFAQMEAADPKEISALLVLIRRQVATPGSVSQDEWDRATGGRYMELNRQNTSHFAPRDTSLVAASATSSGVNHKEEWEKNHKLALDAAVAGDRDRALAINAFGDHYLTDAFAAGHLFNKEDLMKMVRDSLNTAAAVKAFAAAVANQVFTDVGDVAICSGYETVATTMWRHWPISDAGRFAQVLEGIDQKMPDILPNSVAAAVHDSLNANGVEVSNAKATWTVKGDDSLESQGLLYMREAVAQSQVNVMNTVKGSTPGYAALFKAVWDLTPQPDTSGKAAIAKAVKELADPKTAATVQAVAKITHDNLTMIMDKVVAAGVLRKVK